MSPAPRGPGRPAPTTGPPAKRTDRLTTATQSTLRPDSLVGSFFHGDGPGWDGYQGCVVAQVGPEAYLVEVFGWIGGDSSCQHLARVQEMGNWAFYDDDTWMNNAYEHGKPFEQLKARRAKMEADEHAWVREICTPGGGSGPETAPRAEV